MPRSVSWTSLDGMKKSNNYVSDKTAKDRKKDDISSSVFHINSNIIGNQKYKEENEESNNNYLDDVFVK